MSFALEMDTADFRDELVPADARRDPRKDPQPGDVLANGADVREVWDRVGGSIEYGFPGKNATRWLPLIRWQAWARLADVRKVAA